MVIGISALTLIPGKSGGIETYFHTLLTALQKIDSVNKYFVFVTPKNADAVNVYADNFVKVYVKFSTRQKVLNRANIFRKQEEYYFSNIIRGKKCDIVHFPLHVIYPGLEECKKIISVMDIQEEYWPSFFSNEDRANRKKYHMGSILTADHIVTISKYTKQTILEKYKIKPDIITPIHISHNEDLFLNASVNSHTVKLPEKYFYYPASTWPHKNHLMLIDAFNLFLKSKPEYKLVLSGIKKQDEDKIFNKIQKLELQDNIVFLGYLEAEQLPCVYKNAFALVFPSLFEGFGIPVLEAFASSCPVICSNSTSLPEVAGSAALFFDPNDPKDIAKKMQELVNRPGLRNDLIKAGAKQLKNFSQDKMARETLEVYKKVGKHA